MPFGEGHSVRPREIEPAGVLPASGQHLRRVGGDSYSSWARCGCGSGTAGTSPVRTAGEPVRISGIVHNLGQPRNNLTIDLHPLCKCLHLLPALPGSCYSKVPRTVPTRRRMPSAGPRQWTRVHSRSEFQAPHSDRIPASIPAAAHKADPRQRDRVLVAMPNPSKWARSIRPMRRRRKPDTWHGMKPLASGSS